MTIKALMQNPRGILRANDPLPLDCAVGALDAWVVVTESGRIAGVVNTRDVRAAGPSTLPALAVHEHPSLTARLTVGHAVRGAVVIVPVDASPGDAAAALLRTGQRAAVVTEGVDTVGVVTIDDLIGALTDRLERQAPSGIARILVAVSLSAPGRRPSTLDTGLALARRHRATTTLLHVMPGVSRRVAAGLPAGVEADVNRWRLSTAREALAALAPSDAPMPVRVDVRAGHIVDGVLAAAAEAHADLIVVGRRGAGRLARAVIRRAPCPVIAA